MREMGSAFGLQWCREIINRQAKEEIGARVATLVRSGDVIGVGSGSTSFISLLAIADRCRKEGLDIAVVPTSIEMQFAAEALGLTLCTDVPLQISWCFDGADEVDANNRLIKGRGGALYRERQIFTASQIRYVIADHTKSVDRLGINFPVPVEVEWPCARRTYESLIRRAHVEKVVLRQGVAKDGPVITEGGAIIFDVKYAHITETEHTELMEMPGVRGTGIFSGFDFVRIDS